ncbi:MAG: DivIVA protein [Firmicutes bacterium ADurb.Bin456]|nr:MAG: DivIVA protein [Firmicutes bacterium ADurb.Bin456]
MNIEEILKSKEGWFKTTFRGYKPADVDYFFQEVSRYCHGLIEEKKRLEEELTVCGNRAGLIRGAGAAAVEIRARAEAEAQCIQEKAKIYLEQLPPDAGQKTRRAFQAKCLFETLGAHRKKLRAAAQELKEGQAYCREQETYIHAALIKAERIAAQTVLGAEEERKKILDIAAQEAEEIILGARKNSLEIIREAEQYKQQVEDLLYKHKRDGEKLLNKLSGYIESQLNSLKDIFFQDFKDSLDGLCRNYTAISKPDTGVDPASEGPSPSTR